MTEQKLDRPATLKRPPQPSPDEKVDPIPIEEPAPKAPRRKVTSASKPGYLEYQPKQREVVFPLSTRMAETPTKVLEAEVARSGKSVRAAVEYAIMNTYGQDGKQS